MRKVLAACVSVILASLLLLGCTGSSPQSQSAAAPDKPKASVAQKSEPMVLKTSTFYPATHLQTAVSKELARRIEVATEGRVKLEIFVGETLGPIKEALIGAHSGSIDAFIGQMGNNVGEENALELANIPWGGAPSAKDQGQAALEITSLLQKEAFTKFNIRVLYSTLWPSSTGLITRKEVRVPADLKGLKMRSPGGAMDKLLSQWGASVVSLPSSEVPEALMRGVADGTPATLPTALQLKLVEPAPYVADINIAQGGQYMAFNKDKWNRMSSVDQKAIDGLLPEFLVYHFNEAAKDAEAARAEMDKSKTIKRYVPNAQEMSLWKSGTRVLWDEYAKTSPLAQKIVDVLRRHGL